MAKRKKQKIIRVFLLCFLISFILTGIGITVSLLRTYPARHTEQASPQAYLESKKTELPKETILPEVILHGSRARGQIALTFDADMTEPMRHMLQTGKVKSWYNKDVKNTLDRENVKATVFLTGLWAKTYPKEAKELAMDPLIEIGNHSYSHPAFTKHCFGLPFITNSKVKAEVLDAQKEIQAITGKTPKFFRFPGGCYNAVDVAEIAKLNLTIAHWDVVGGDAFNTNVNAMVKQVERLTQNGSIIVFHLNAGQYAPKTNDALVKLIPFLKKKNFQFVTLSEMFGL